MKPAIKNGILLLLCVFVLPFLSILCLFKVCNIKDWWMPEVIGGIGIVLYLILQHSETK
jgi:1,4-dihydroxy-2-naphthoate octaprenyltransferase